MRATQTGEVLVIHERPGCMWAFGLFFSVIGVLLVYGSLGGFTNRDEVPQYAVILSFLIGAAGVAAGIWIVFRAPVTNVIIDRDRKILIHSKLGLFGKKEQVYGFAQLNQFCVIEEKDDDGDSIWSLGMELTDGSVIKISSLQSHHERFKRDFVFQANQFMQKQIPSYKSGELEEKQAS